jgi:hypothetical protein
MDLCTDTELCVAMSVNCDGICTLFGAVTGQSVNPGYCGVAAEVVEKAGDDGGGDGGDVVVVTVSVCAVPRPTWTRTKTVKLTKTATSCPPDGYCTKKMW